MFEVVAEATSLLPTPRSSSRGVLRTERGEAPPIRGDLEIADLAERRSREIADLAESRSREILDEGRAAPGKPPASALGAWKLDERERQ